ncbi:MFS general substrate transporter-like protein [Achaetomium macrosporum]|uniref:MFS general substrate transporter-like protein n=1 Tax=Achaetomium macrosporum TaxID=79813 RepID=A0AAN7C3W6_9PEZI|nr:MFS general substrate transporter-like protein [Achaetomium macrosporum]
MVHTTAVAASAATTNAPGSRPPPRPRRSRASGSFHAGEPFSLTSPYDEPLPSSSRSRRISAAEARRPLRRQSTPKYHTFPTPPPSTPSERQRSPLEPRPWYKRLFGPKDEVSDVEDGGGAVNLDGALPGDDEHGGRRKRRRRSSLAADTEEDAASGATTPLPWMQLSLLALLSLAEQTALNSIGPYLPTLVASFNEIPDGQEGLYVGLLASAFALAQLATNLLWGYLSDRVGRKPTMLLGTSLLMGCFLFFGFCQNYAQLIMVHVAMGLLNGNAAIVPTCLGEVTDRTNQSSAFTWLPVIYSLGSITGPALGGLLVGVGDGARYPFLAPNVVVAALLLSSVVVLGIWFEETLDGVEHSASEAGLDWARGARNWCWGGVRRLFGQPQSVRDALAAHVDDDAENSDDSDDEQQGLLGTDEADHDSKKGADEDHSALRELRNRNTIAVLGTYLVFQLANISYNSLYPIFGSSPPPTGRDLGPGIIGVSLSLAGLATILFQLSIFQRLKARIGNLVTYRYSLLGMAVSMALMPFVGYVDGSGKGWLYAELGSILVLKNICAVGGLSSVMLLITNSAPSNETLGTLQGIAQTLSAAGRSVGPFLSGGLFTLSTRVRPKGEALAWGIFAGVTLVGWLGSFVIRNHGLESAEFDDDSDEAEMSGDEQDVAV